MRTHKVGTITLGLTLVICGIVFLLQMLIPGMTFWLVCRFWPLIFIILGVEILISNWRDKEGTFIYDKGSILLTFIVIGFAMILGLISQIVMYAGQNIQVTF